MTMTGLVNANSLLMPLPDKSVHLTAFSPPYWSKRVYETGAWVGGDPDCAHSFDKQGGDNKHNKANAIRNTNDTSHCYKCGAVRQDEQLGLEPLHDCMAWANGYANVGAIIKQIREVYSHSDIEPELRLHTIMGMMEEVELALMKPSPPCGHCFVCNLRKIAKEVHRVLRDDGVMWINLGDSFYGGKGKSSQAWSMEHQDRNTIQKPADHLAGKGQARPSDMPNPTLKPKDLVGIPFRVAMALQADGWYWRTIAPWVKPSCMPESVSDRPSVAHEQILMFTKSRHYYYDPIAIKQPRADSTIPRMGRGRGDNKNSSNVPGQSVNSINRPSGGGEYNNWDADGRNRRDTDWFMDSLKIGVVESATWVQTALEAIDQASGNDTTIMNGDDITGFVINPEGWPGNHYAVWPGDLVKPMILSGTSEYGCCPKCGKQWVRVTKKSRTNRKDNPNDALPYAAAYGHNNGKGKTTLHKVTTVETMWWEPECGCAPGVISLGLYDSLVDGTNKPIGDIHDRMGLILSAMPEEFRPVPSIVLDPFAGSGTTLQVARELGRNAIGLDLSFEYLEEEAKTRLDLNRLEAWEKGWGKEAKAIGETDSLPLLSLMGV